MMRTRHGARIILLGPDNRFLLFRFHYTDGPLAGMNYWAVPGGGVEEGEDAPAAAIRELAEETGLAVAAVGEEVCAGEYDFRLSSGERVRESDHYFLLKLAKRPILSRNGYTEEEAANLIEHRWWTLEEVRVSAEPVIPGNLAHLLETAGIGAV